MQKNEQTVANQKNASIGTAIERQFKNAVLNKQHIKNIISNRYGNNNNIQAIYFVGTNLQKSDVIITFNDRKIIGVNIKAGKTNFNQITRIWLKDFSENITLSEKSYQILEDGIKNYCKGIKKFIVKSDEQKILSNELKNKTLKIMNFIFTGNDTSVKILALYNRNTSRFYLYDMNEFLNLYTNQDITFSKKGIIKFGEFITLQRKGGNGVQHKIPKSSLTHPGNQLQFKIKILSFIEKSPLKVICSF
jgi:hypothetical protein